MSTRAESSVYSPYGAWELKATYQRNLLLGTFLTTAMVLMSLGGAWVFSAEVEPIVPPPPLDKYRIVKDIPPKLVIVRGKSEFKPSGRRARIGHIPVPVPDSLIIDDDVAIASRDELAELSPSGEPTGGDGLIGTEDPFDGSMSIPCDTCFVPLEIQPEMIYRHQPVYPRLAAEADFTGVVWVRVLVDENGDVLESRLVRTSGVVSLDEAAVKAALECKYKPAIQNGRAISVWVAYKYEFEGRD